jgi:hypothetical protein
MLIVQDWLTSRRKIHSLKHRPAKEPTCPVIQSSHVAELTTTQPFYDF